MGEDAGVRKDDASCGKTLEGSQSVHKPLQDVSFWAGGPAGVWGDVRGLQVGG